ncbi:MAG: hypothetical protein LJE84_06595 [Gammaproteobacteria bacterium]|nr:hypothetical protein [Gammaproteobacteria bacterium]
MLRPRPTLWTEILVRREDAGAVLETLARSQLMELERQESLELPFEEISVAPARASTEAAIALMTRYRDVLPPPRLRRSASEVAATTHPEPSDTLAALQGWARDIQPLREAMRTRRAEQDRLEHLARCLAAVSDDGLDLSYLAREDVRPWRAFLALREGPRENLKGLMPAGSEVRYFDAAEKETQTQVALGLVPAADYADVESRLHGRRWQFAVVPGWLQGQPPAARRQLQERLAALARECGEIRARVAELNTRHDAAGLRWIAEWHAWLAQALASSWSGAHFLLLTGWVPADRYRQLVQGLERSGLPFLARHVQPVEGGQPPVVLRNPRWSRPFEVFVRAFGLPGVDAADPSPLLAIVMPLMFGYMFGDVGHGLLLLLTGWALRRRVPVLGLLIPAGVSSMAFGFLFGSVFSNEHWLAPLWVHPMEDPLLILAVPLVFGVGLMLTGIALAVLQSWWNRALAGWWREELPSAGTYIGILVAIASVPLGIAVVVAALLVGVGLRFAGGGSFGQRLASVGDLLAGLLEDIFQLLINTLSFVRVGAFALAHAGLSSAVISLAGMSDALSLQLLTLVLGNLFVTALEGLVVSIQTTRLVLFEFFRRFLHTGGRPFRPLLPPESVQVGTA